jgi:carbamoyltransferase
VALNCAANGLLDEPVYAPPIPHDAGVALGAAWHVAPPRAAQPLDPYLGPDVSEDMPDAPERDGLVVEPLDIDRIAEAMAAGRIGAVAEGRAEVGPRALCARSIIASPADPGMRDRVNAVKDREPWRPFGPVGLRSGSARLWGEREHLTRYMIGGLPVTDEGRRAIPAAIHVDGTARPQVMDDDAQGTVAELLRRRNGDALINTSFNVRGQPIVTTGRDALAAFRAMELDFLVLDGELYAKRADWWRPA